MADLEETVNRKRRATSYITKDDVENDGSSSDEGPTERKTFRKADPAVIAAREKLAPRRRFGSVNPTKEAVDAILNRNSNPAPPAELVPKPTVGNWKPAALNFAGTKKAEASPAKPTDTPQAEETKTSDVKVAAVPNAFSAKYVSLSSKLGPPPASAKPVEGEGTANEATSSNSDANASPAASTLSRASSASKPAEIAPLVGTGFKFTANTKWSFGKSASPSDAASDAAAAPAAAKEGEESAKVAPATQRTWNFMKNVKPAPLSSHFPSAATTASPEASAKKPFQFGKNVAPAKAGEPSKEVLKDLAVKKEESGSKLSEAAPVVTVTGEEQETPLFTADAKLFELEPTDKTWPERGVGVFRVNQLKTDATRLRLVMHVKTTLKLILNSPVYASMTVVPTDKQPTCIKFTGIPIPVPISSEQKAAQGDQEQNEQPEKKTPAISVFNLKFRDSETAARALKTIKDALEQVKAAPTTSISTDQKPSETQQSASEPSQGAADAKTDEAATSS